MKISMHEASFSVFIRIPNSLAAILEKAAAHAKARSVSWPSRGGTRTLPGPIPQ
jgi:hypothetical protein